MASRQARNKISSAGLRLLPAPSSLMCLIFHGRTWREKLNFKGSPSVTNYQTELQLYPELEAAAELLPEPADVGPGPATRPGSRERRVRVPAKRRHTTHNPES